MRNLAQVVASIGCIGGIGCSSGPGAVVDGVPSDAGLDAPADPFAGMFVDPAQFPHTNCTPGSLAGFAYTEYWPEASMRTTHDNGELQTYVGTFLGDELHPHLLTADDLLVRTTQFSGTRWSLFAVDVCGADADGTLHGSSVFCFDTSPQFCTPTPYNESPLHRIAGEAEGLGLVRLGEWNGGATPWPATATTNVRVDGTIAYVGRLEDGLRIVSIADPSAPVELGHFVMPGDNVNDLKLVRGNDGRRYVVTASNPARIIDVTDPVTPELAAELPESPHTLFIEGQTAYFADAIGGDVPVYDLSDPHAPHELGAWHGEPPAAYHDLYVENGIVLLSDSYGGGLVIVNMQDPAHPHLVGAENAGDGRYWHSPWLTHVAGKPIALDGDEFPGSGLRILDGDPAAATFLHPLAEWHLRDAVSMHNVMASGPRVYIAHYRDGIRVLDLSQPSAPTMVGYYNTWIEGTGPATVWAGTFGIDVDYAQRRIYVADSIRGLMILQGDATIFP